MKRLGRYTLLFERRPAILGHAAVCGKKEAAGPLARDFDQTFLHDVAPNRVYMAAQSPARRCALTAPFHPYLQCRRYISVALSLGSPPAAVSRYSRPVELGLSSDAAFRRTPAAVRLTRKICEMVGF